MEYQALLKRLPLIHDWAVETVQAAADEADPLIACDLARLHPYFPGALLSDTWVVVTDSLPAPPLGQWFGTLREFTRFEKADGRAITLLDTIFVKRAVQYDDIVLAHELVHVIQWDYLGPERFLLAYGIGLSSEGYTASPLEKMARRHAARVEADLPAYDIAAAVRQELAASVGPQLDEIRSRRSSEE